MFSLIVVFDTVRYQYKVAEILKQLVIYLVSDKKDN